MSKDQLRDQRFHEASPVIAKARALAAAGHHAAVVEFLGSRDQSELADPTLALLYGIAQARLGRHEQGLQWIDRALAGARQRDERGVERHALNARGAIALVSGNLTEAADFCTQALMAASRDSDHAITGRASNNMGIISHRRGSCPAPKSLCAKSLAAPSCTSGCCCRVRRRATWPRCCS